MDTFAIAVSVVLGLVVVGILGSAIGNDAGLKSGETRGEATICAEIDWHSTTCEKLKAERLKP
jgi:hypothetical protein